MALKMKTNGTITNDFVLFIRKAGESLLVAHCSLAVACCLLLVSQLRGRQHTHVCGLVVLEVVRSTQFSISFLAFVGGT